MIYLFPFLTRLMEIKEQQLVKDEITNLYLKKNNSLLIEIRKLLAKKLKLMEDAVNDS